MKIPLQGNCLKVVLIFLRCLQLVKMCRCCCCFFCYFVVVVVVVVVVIFLCSFVFVSGTSPSEEAVRDLSVTLTLSFA